MVFTKKAVVTIIGLALLPLVAVEAVFINSNFVIAKPTKASEYQTILNKDNVPSISAGEGSLIDDKNVTWEYHNASNKANYHVSLAHQGYFGVSSSTAWGYTAIESISVTFSGQTKSELWLLASVNGTEWHEMEILTSATPTTVANDWRYIRFYHYDDEATTGNLDVEAVYIDYGCVGISATEDMDGAILENVVQKSDNLTASRETTEISPRSDGGEAIKFTKSGSSTGGSNMTISLGRTYTVGSTKYTKVEFDMKTSNITYGKTLQLMKGTSGVGATIDSSKGSSYIYNQIQDDWYHIEVPLTVLVPTISGYKDKDNPASGLLNKQYDGIKINAGSCVIDNLRIGSSPCALGLFNSPTYSPVVNEVFWVKASWVGAIYIDKVSITFDDPECASRIPLTDPNLKNGSPFYIQWLKKGTFTVTCSVTCGYDRHVQTISKAFTVS